MEPGKPETKSKTPAQATPGGAGNFVRDLILEDLAANRHGGRVTTRFPPEPNGYLHIGHAKAIWIDFGLAREFGGTCNLRFDDTNPTTEDVEYVDAIQHDIRWLGFDWTNKYYASDYFEALYELAVKLIEKGKAYVDSLTEEEIREYRGDFYKKGKPSPYRTRPVAENLELFRRMRGGEFSEGAHVLRAIIDLETQNMNMRDPVLYRIRYAPHHRTGTKWCIYPMYDYAHPLSDAIERITHSICTVEFESHRPLYDWCIREAEVFPSRQIEFARLNLTYTVMSKRKLAELVQKGLVSGWDDPRMPTLAGLRRRGYTPEAIRAFCDRIGVSKTDSLVDVGLLEHGLREDLNRRSPRVMVVLRPLKVVIENFPEGEVRELDAPLHPEDPAQGSRKLPLSRVIYVERDDFREDPPKDWFRLAPGREVRLRYACLIKCTGVVKDAGGEIVELRCTWDPGSWGGSAPDGRVVRGTLHWVSAAHAVPAEVRLYDRLFSVENPGAQEGKSFIDEMNPDSMVRLPSALTEPYLAQAGLAPGARTQFERLGYFCLDPESTPTKQVWNRTVTLKDSWAKLQAKSEAKPSTKPDAAGASKAGKKVDKKPGQKIDRTTDDSIGKKPDEKADKSTDKKPELAVEKKTDAPAAPVAEIGIDDLTRVDLRVGVVREASQVPDAQKLIRLMVDLGEGRLRQIFTGLRAFYPDPAALVGQSVVVVANLKPRQMKFGLSEGMILAAGGDDRPYRIATFAAGDNAPRPGDKIT
jgi:glutaminyl-tRNA synthetase